MGTNSANCVSTVSAKEVRNREKREVSEFFLHFSPCVCMLLMAETDEYEEWLRKNAQVRDFASVDVRLTFVGKAAPSTEAPGESPGEVEADEEEWYDEEEEDEDDESDGDYDVELRYGNARDFSADSGRFTPNLDSI